MLVKRVFYDYNSLDNFKLDILVMFKLFISKYTDDEKVNEYYKN